MDLEKSRNPEAMSVSATGVATANLCHSDSPAQS